MLKNTKNIKYIVIILFITAVAFGSVFLYSNNHKSDNEKSPASEESSSAAVSEINYDPPTEQDKQEAEDNKQKIVDKSEQSSTPVSSTVTPVVTYAGLYDGNVEVGGYVPNIFEENGTCSATFTKDGYSAISKSVDAVRGANSVDCPQISVSSNDFSAKGTWSVTLSYKSNTYSGTSAVRSFEVK